MILPAFKNKENPRHIINDSPVWLSRASAVVAEIILINAITKEPYILLGKRGEKTPDFQGYWCLPCGYLDWDETLPEAVLREVYEECGLYLPNIPLHNKFLDVLENSELLYENTVNHAQPWHVNSTAKSKQNISLHYKTLVFWEGDEFPKLSYEFAEEGEVSDLQWFKLSDALKEKLAFNHNDVLNILVDKTFIPFFKK